MSTNELRKSALTQIKKYLKRVAKEQSHMVFLSKCKQNLIYVEFNVASTITEEEMNILQTNFDKELNKLGIEVEVRKAWF